MIVATTLLNKTNGKAALPIFWELIKRWPTPKALSQASASSLTELLRPIGTQNVRASRLIRLSNAYITYPPTLTAEPRPKPEGGFRIVQTNLAQSYIGRSITGSKASCTTELKTKESSQTLGKEYRAVQKTMPIAYLPFTGPYAIDSFRIFSPALNGGGAGTRVEEQLGRVTRLAELGQCFRDYDDFDEAPSWYNPMALRVDGDDDAEWRKVWPEDKQLRRYLVRV